MHLDAPHISWCTYRLMHLGVSTRWCTLMHQTPLISHLTQNVAKQNGLRENWIRLDFVGFLESLSLSSRSSWPGPSWKSTSQDQFSTCAVWRTDLLQMLHLASWRHVELVQLKPLPVLSLLLKSCSWSWKATVAICRQKHTRRPSSGSIVIGSGGLYLLKISWAPLRNPHLRKFPEWIQLPIQLCHIQKTHLQDEFPNSHDKSQN